MDEGFYKPYVKEVNRMCIGSAKASMDLTPALSHGERGFLEMKAE